MAEGMGQAIDPSGEARSVLQSAVTDYGDRVLSNAAILDGICEDRLPEWPREASLVSIAARADVAAMLQQQAGGVGPDAAVRLTAAALADSRSIDPSAALWVVGEFARALGYQVSEGLQPAPAAPSPAAPSPAAAGIPAAPVPDARPAPATSPPGSPGDDLTVQPAGLQHPPTQQVGFGNRETVTTGQGAQQPGLQQPAVQPGMPPPGMPPPGMPPPGMPPPGGQAGGGYGWAPPAATPPGGAGWPGGTQPGPPGMPPPPAGGGRPPRQGRVLGIGAIVLVVLVLVIVGVDKLVSSGKNPGPPPTPTPTATTPRPTPSASTFQPTSGDLTLESLIPADVSANGSCTPVHTPAFGATAEMHCAGAPNIPPGYVQYYLFGSTGSMNAAYSTFVANFARTSKNTGRCHQVSGTSAFRTFSPCETQFSIGSTAEGRVAEYFYKGTPDISCVFSVDKVLVDMQGSDGTALIRWWDHSPHWINS